MGMLLMKTLGVILLLAVLSLHAEAIDIHRLRLVAAKYNVTCILVFGDSSVDPGNNNRLKTSSKCNFPPYGKDFSNGRPTGRFTNGRLATDFIAAALGFTEMIPGFLDPQIKTEDLLHGVSFASGSSGYDDLTANLSDVISFPKQLEYFKHYKIRLSRLVGKREAEEIVKNAVFVVSMGTNDFLQNYYLEPTRSEHFTVEQYQNYLISCMYRDFKGLYTLGARRFVVVGLSPFGCSPLVKTLKDETKCDHTYNQVALSFNSKLKAKLETLKSSLGVIAPYVDVYRVIERILLNPKKYGFTVTSKGCCGSGTYEYSFTCRGLSTCADRTKYMFWDAVHFTESMYKIIADEAIKALNENLLK